MIQAIANIGTAFGLASSAGLNAYIPLLIVAIAARFPLDSPFLALAEPYDILGSWWAIGILTVLLIIEMTVDKIPAIDTLNDVIHTFVRPAAGAVLFAANSNVISDIHPALALTAGLLVAGGVHAAKGTTRPLITATTAGSGNWFVSLLEDIAAFFLSLFALLLPLIAGIFSIGLIIFIILMYRRYKQRQRKMVPT
ncbi:MAG: DUF4126 domain-containing protein [Chloroflexota bacterium]